MALQGTLDTFALADLVRLLATTSKTGELVIDGDRGTGRLWFADGILVGGEPAGEGGSADAVFALLRFEEGGFRFEADVSAPEGAGAPGDALALLSEAEERIEAWRPIEAVVPSPAVTLHLRAELAQDDVHLDREQWRLVTTIAGGATAGAVAEALDLDEVGAATRIKDLVDAGAVEVGPAAETEPEGPPPGLPVAHESESDLRRASSVLVAAEVPEVATEEPTAAPVGFDPVELVDPLTEADVVASDPTTEDDESTGPAVAVGGQPRPTLRSLSRPEPEADGSDEDSGSFASRSTAPEPLLSFEGAIDPPEDMVLPEPAATPRAELLDGPGGSTDVDLDAPAQGDTDGHRYLGATDEIDGLPEPLLAPGPEALPVEAEASAAHASDVDDLDDGSSDRDDPTDAGEIGDLGIDEVEGVRAAWPAPPADEDMAVQLDALSPAAARAVAAAASDGDVGDDTDAGRKVLRRIISTGRG